MKSLSWKWFSAIAAAIFYVSASSAAPPVFDPIGDEYWVTSLVEVVEGEPAEFSVTAVDPDGDAVTLAAEGLPPWAAFDPNTGVFIGMPSLWSDDYEIRKDQPGKFDVTFTATDGTYTVEKHVVVMVLERDWSPRTLADIVASRPITSGGDPGTPVEIRDVVDETITTPFAGGKQVRRISFGFTSQVPDVAGWETDWVADLNYAYLPLDTPAAYNVGGVVEGGYAQSWGDTALAMQACAELDIPVLIIDMDWSFAHGGDVMSKHNEKTVQERAPEYIFYSFSSAHYLRALDALVTVIDSLTTWPISFEDFRAAFTGHSKFGHTCLAAAALDTHRVVGFMSSGSAGIDNDAFRLLANMLGDSELSPEASPNYLGTIMKYFTDPQRLQHQANSSLQAIMTQGTRDGVKYGTLCGDHALVLPHRMCAIPNLMHSTQSPHHSMIWRMWLAHCFLDRPISTVTSVHHEPSGDSLLVTATVSGLPTVTSVVLFATEEPDMDPGFWEMVTPLPMELDGDAYRARIPGTTTMYYVEVHDLADGISGIISTVPTPVNRDYPLLPLSPGEVMAFSATVEGEDIHLTWETPNDEDFAGVLIRYATTDYPEDPTQGSEVYDGNDTTYTHIAAPLGEGCYYSAFSYDTTGCYSEAGTLFVEADSTQSDSPRPSEFRLDLSPNPFSSSCRIELYLKEETQVVLEVVDVAGRVVKTLLDNELVNPGLSPITLDTGNLASGVYCLRLTSEERTTTRSVVLIR